MKLAALFACAALVACAAGDDVTIASAPAPSTAPKADLLFILSANTANFTSPTRLTLGNVSYTVQFTGNNRAGIYPIGLFMNSSDGAPFTSANGDWLGGPQTVLYGTQESGNMTSVVLDLSNPSYNPRTNEASFDVSVATTPKYKQGSVASSINDSAKNLGPVMLTSVNATTELRAVALFIDTHRLALGKAAETKWFGWGGGWGGWGGGWGGGWDNGWGGGWNHGWNGGWGYQPYYYNNGWNNGGWGGCGGCGCCG